MSPQPISAADTETIMKAEAGRALLRSTFAPVPIQQGPHTAPDSTFMLSNSLPLAPSALQQPKSIMRTPGLMSMGRSAPDNAVTVHHSPGDQPNLRSTSTSPPHIDLELESQTDATLESVIKDFSSIVIIATFLASVSIVMLALARSVADSPNVPTTSISKILHVILQVFGCLSVSFNLAVAIVAGSAASSQSLQLRLGQHAREFSRSQALDAKLHLCSTLLHYGLLVLTVAIACLFGLLLNSPYALLMIIPVLGVIFYDALFRGRIY